jgi:hypothetical protein
VLSKDDLAIDICLRHFPREQEFNLKMNFFLRRRATF